MLGRFDLGLGRSRMRALTAAKALFAVTLLAGCSSVPDAVNPVEWYKGAEDLITGRERTEVAAPVPPKGEFPDTKTPADTRKGVAKGLPADKSNSKYAEPVRREAAPTKQLARRTPAAGTQVADAAPAAAAPAGAVPPKPAVTAQELAPPTQVAQASGAPAARAGDRLSADRRAPQARDDGPAAPPASVNMTPPPAADVPETVPVRGRPRPLQEQFQKRLAESAQQTVYPGMVDMPNPARGTVLAGARDDEPIHLVPPSSRRAVKGGGKGMAAPAPVFEPAASFQVASVDFRAGSADLTGTDRAAIAEVARLYKQTGGVVRVVGFSPAYAPASYGRGDAVNQLMGGLEASMKRANAVARELSRRGVPAGKIMVGGDTASAAGIGAQVYIDVI